MPPAPPPPWPLVGPYQGGLPSAPPPGPPRRPGRAILVGAGAVLTLILLGLPLGLLWASVAPSIPVRKTEEGAVLTNPQPEEFIAADGWFSVLGLGFGVLAAIALWLLLRRYRGPSSLLVLALGGVGAAIVAWQVGRRIGLAEYQRLLETAPVDKLFNKPPDLRAGAVEWLYGWIPTVQGDLLLPAFGAVVTYTLLAGWSRWPGLRPEPEPPAVSWGWSAPPAPAAAPAPPESGAAEPPRG